MKSNRVTIEAVRARVGPLLQQMPGMRLYRQAAEEGYANLSELLEDEDPTTAADARLGLDAFERMLLVKGIRTTGHPEGVYVASTGEAFMADEETKALFPEWVRRQWASARRRRPPQVPGLALDPGDGERAPAIYLSGDYTVGSVQRPYDDDTTLRLQGIEPAIPLSEVVARVRMNDGIDYRARWLVEPVDANAIRMMRVAEGTEIPKAKLMEKQSVIRLSKFGRALEITYEAARRLPLDDLAVHIRLLSVQTEVDQVAAARDTMVNGDGNAGTAGININLTTLDPTTTANNLTAAAWIAFLTEWPNPYSLTGVLGQRAAILKLLMLSLPTNNPLLSQLGPQQAPLAQAFRPMNPNIPSGQAYGIDPDAPANKLIGFDGRFAVEHVRENGSVINEAERFITRQVEVMTFSFNEGFSVFRPNTVRVLNLAA